MSTGRRRSSMYDGDTTDEARRSSRRILVAVLALLALVVVGVVVVLGQIRSDDDDKGAGATTVPPDVTAAAGSAMKSERVTAQGLTVRLGTSDDASQFAQPVPTGAPAWCETSGLAFGSIISDAAVAQTQIPLSKVAGPDGAGQLMLGGTLEGAPIWGVILQVPPSVVLVRATLPGGLPDEMEPVEGLAIVAMTAPLLDAGAPGRQGPADMWGGADLREAVVELVSASGQHQRIDVETGLTGPPMWNDQRCFQNFVGGQTDPEPPAPPELPDPGEQPPDPVAARAEVAARLTDLFGAPVEEGLEFFDLLDDASGIDISIASTLKDRTDLQDLLQDGRPELIDLVFISPVEAFFLYDLNAPFGRISNRFGRARFTDGRWKVTRGTFCQEVSPYGVYCGV